MFDIGNEAWLVDEQGDEPECNVVIVNRRVTAGEFQYQVKNKATNLMIDGGDWFPQTSLNFSKYLF
jgi:hypothetical protein